MTTYNKFFIRTYASLEQVREILSEHDEEIKSFAFIEHNHDDCEWHRHIVLWLERSKAQTTVQNWFKSCFDSKGLPCQTRVEVTKKCNKSDGTCEVQTVDLQGATYYLVHEDKQGNPLPNKYHYLWEEVESKNLELLKSYEFGATKHKKEDNTFEILQQVMDGVSPYELAKKYGRDFILNYRKYVDIASSCLCFEQESIRRKADADMEVKRIVLEELCVQAGAKPLTSELLRENVEEIERLRSILRSNGLEY